MRAPDWDIDLAKGAQAELWVSDVRKALAGTARIEVKAPALFLEKESFFVEYECRGRDGIWRPSGIATSKAPLFFFTFGRLPGGLVVEKDWLKRAARLSYRKGLKTACLRGSNPTHAVLVGLAELWATRDGEP